MKTQISDEELRDIVFAVSALTLEEDYSLVPYNRNKHIRTTTRMGNYETKNQKEVIEVSV